MKKLMLLAVSTALLMSCTSKGTVPNRQTETPARAQAVTQAEPIPDSRIGLAAGTAFDQPTQGPIAFNDADPGESEPRTPPNGDFPPVIPHSIQDLQAITRAENACLSCHEASAAADLGAPALPASHEVDLRYTPETQDDEIVGARWVCTSCHVEQTRATPLVALTTVD